MAAVIAIRSDAQAGVAFVWPIGATAALGLLLVSWLLRSPRLARSPERELAAFGNVLRVFALLTALGFVFLIVADIRGW